MKIALIGFTTVNLGDDLQSIASSLNLPHVDRIVDRERLANLRLDEPHFLLTQSWFTRQWFWPPADTLEPYFFGFCFGRPRMRRGLWPRYLKRFEPIGARDLGSIERLARVGVDAFWSGCLTLRIGRFARTVPAEERSGTYIVDLPPEAEAMVAPDIRERAIRLSNAVPEAMMDDPLARMSRIARISDRLRHADLVITKRLHTALPCVGFRTPVQVIAAADKGHLHRFSGFDRFVRVAYYEEGKPAPAIDWSAIAPVDIPDELNQRYDRLRSDFVERLGRVGDTVYEHLHRRDMVTLPNPELGPETGKVAIDLGMRRVERVPSEWTDRTITIEIESYASFERTRHPILVQGYGRKDWLEVGRTDTAIAAGRMLTD